MAVGGEHHYQLEFRSSDRTGANAFALPSGIIVITDALLEVAEDDRELIAVLAHEVGHVVNRHVLRRAIQGSVVTLLMGTLTGDVISVSTLAVTIPVALMEAKYSREFESEADRFAIQYLSHKNISTQYFVAILQRLDQSHNAEKRATGFLDTHPASTERIALLEDGVLIAPAKLAPSGTTRVALIGISPWRSTGGIGKLPDGPRTEGLLLSQPTAANAEQSTSASKCENLVHPRFGNSNAFILYSYLHEPATTLRFWVLPGNTYQYRGDARRFAAAAGTTQASL